MRITGLDHLTVTVPAASDLGHPVRPAFASRLQAGRWCGIAFAIDFLSRPRGPHWGVKRTIESTLAYYRF